jgi:hydrogenase maturation protease
MPDLREKLRQCFQGRVCLMGLGSVDYGDDGFGIHLAEKLADAGVPDVVSAGTVPERLLGSVSDSGYDYLVFLDAAEFGAAPGSVILLNAEEMAARFPQISTHKISLGLLAKWVEDSGRTKALLLGVQPESLKAAGELTPTVQTTLEILAALILDLKADSKVKVEASQPLNDRPKAEAPNTEVNV